MENLSAGLLWGIFRHVRSWLSNLDRAGLQRKEQSVRALRGVIIAARETAVYIRRMKDTGQRHHDTESHLAVLWTELGFALQDLRIDKLAKRCRISGKHWSNPEYYDQTFLKRADVSLEQMERLAQQILQQTGH